MLGHLVSLEVQELEFPGPGSQQGHLSLRTVSQASCGRTVEDALQGVLFCFVSGALRKGPLVQDCCIHKANQLLNNVDNFVRAKISSHLVLEERGAIGTSFSAVTQM